MMESNCRMWKFTILPFLWAAFFISVISADIESEDNCGYIFTCPRSFKTGATNKMQLRRFGELDAGSLTVNITCQNGFTANDTLAIVKTFDIQEGENLSDMDLYMEPLDTYSYSGTVEIKGDFPDCTMEASDKIYFSPSKDNFVLIQTDKPLYKEGQTVKFRVMRIDKQFKPVVIDNINLWVENPQGIRLFQWMDQSMEDGLLQFDFPLDNEPTKGDWSIKAQIKEDITTSTFQVKEYVLPTYEVVIKPPAYVLANAKEIEFEVCAKYTYGKPVKGNSSLTVSLEKFSWSSDKLPTLEHSEEINGCYKYKFNVSWIEPDDNYYSYGYRRIQIDVSVVEDGTGVMRNATQYIQKQYTPLSLSFNRDQRQFYKPGLPYSGKLFVTNPDNSPAVDEDIEICCTNNRERIVMGGEWKATRTEKTCQNYTTGEDGIIKFVIRRQNTDSTGLNLEAKSLKYSQQNKQTGSRQTISMTQPQTSMSLTPWFSPSGSFIQLQQVPKTLPCGSKQTFNLLFTSKVDKDFEFFYEVIRQGRVVQKGSVIKTFNTEDDVSEKYENEYVIDGDIIQVEPPPDASNPPEVEAEECKSTKDARYVPPVGEVDFDVDVNSDLTPSFHLLVYYIRDDRETVADSQKFTVEKCFKNQVKLQFGDEVKQPGTKTSIRVTSSPNSLCGIKVVDKSISLLDASDQLTPEKVFNALESYDNNMYYGINHCNEPIRQPGLQSKSIMPPRPNQPWSNSKYEDSLTSFETAGLMVISNLTLFTRPCKSRGGGANIAYESAGYGGAGMAMASTARRPAAPAPSIAVEKVGDVGPTKSVVDVRDYFPETWLFELERTGDDGVHIAKETLPHTITEWVGSAVCINSEDGLGISNTTAIKGFQAFFISVTLPYSVKRGETLPVAILVSNYVDESLAITVKLDFSKEYQVVGDSIDGDICVEPGSSSNLKLKIKPKILGTLNITIRAESAESTDVCGSSSVSDALAKDAITKSVIVEAEGWPTENVESILFCPKDENGIFKTSFDNEIPDDVVPDSERCYLDVTGNVLGKSMSNLENLVAVPTGCGEQNMVRFVPLVVVMEVLKRTNELSEKMENRIKRNLITGYQRQMQYRHSDGSFSAFGQRDKDGSMFLTAFVLWWFSQAAEYITIDNSTLVQMQNWIASKQQDNGCFPDVGKIFDRGLQGGLEKENSQETITAYVVCALLKSGYQNQTVLDNAHTCYSGSEDKTFYATFMYAYADALAGREESAKQRIESLKGRSIKKGRTEHYHDVNATKSQDIETTSYGILAKLVTGSSALQVLTQVQYLTENMNPSGGFYSTQDTCVGLHALGEFTKLTFKDPVNINVKVTGGLEKEFDVTEDEKLIVSRNKLEKCSGLELEAEGEGCAIVQSITRCNTNTPPEKRNFNLEVKAECNDKDCKQATLFIIASYLPPEKVTGMCVVEAKMLSGMSPDKASLEKLYQDKNLNLKRYDVADNKVVFYFDEMSNDEKSIEFIMDDVFSVENRQPAPVQVYDYYNRDESRSVNYSLCKPSGEGQTCKEEP